MEFPDKKHWSQNWDERDLARIKEIAEGLVKQGAPTPRAAWLAAEVKYVSSECPHFKKRHLYARLQGS